MAKRPRHLPIVLIREEVRAVLGQIHGAARNATADTGKVTNHGFNGQEHKSQ